jgi:histidine triad (HIT) family protein
MNCIFCKIVADEVQSYKVYEDQDFLAFLSIDPITPGHTLVIPKEHYRWVWDVKNQDKYWLVAQKIAFALRKAFGTEAIHSKVVGEEIHHAHIWLFPESAPSFDKKDLAKNAELIKNAL